MRRLARSKVFSQGPVTAAVRIPRGKTQSERVSGAFDFAPDDNYNRLTRPVASGILRVPSDSPHLESSKKLDSCP